MNEGFTGSGLKRVDLPVCGGVAWVPLRPSHGRMKRIEMMYITASPPRGYVPPFNFKVTLGHLRTLLEKGEIDKVNPVLLQLEGMVATARVDVDRNEVIAMVSSQVELRDTLVEEMVVRWDGVKSVETGEEVAFPVGIDMLDPQDFDVLFGAATEALARGRADPLAGKAPSGPLPPVNRSQRRASPKTSSTRSNSARPRPIPRSTAGVGTT